MYSGEQAFRALFCYQSTSGQRSDWITGEIGKNWFVWERFLQFFMQSLEGVLGIRGEWGRISYAQ